MCYFSIIKLGKSELNYSPHFTSSYSTVISVTMTQPARLLNVALTPVAATVLEKQRTTDGVGAEYWSRVPAIGRPQFLARSRI